MVASSYAEYYGGLTPDEPSLCGVQFTVWGDEDVLEGAVISAKLERPYSITLNYEAARVQHRAVTDENGQATLNLIRLDQFTSGGVYLIEVHDANGNLLSTRRVTIPNLSSTTSTNLTTVG